MIPLQFALRRRMMINASKGAPISDLPLGTLINVGTDGGAGTPNYEIADKDNLVSGGVVLVRKNIHSESAFGTTAKYPDSTLDNLIKTTIYNEMPQKLRDKMMDVTFNLSGSGDITRKMFALTYTMAGFGNNNGVAEGKTLQLYTSNAIRKKPLTARHTPGGFPRSISLTAHGTSTRTAPPTATTCRPRTGLSPLLQYLPKHSTMLRQIQMVLIIYSKIRLYPISRRLALLCRIGHGNR